MKEFNGEFRVFHSSVGCNAIFSQEERFRIVITDSADIYIFSISGFPDSGLKTNIFKFSLNNEDLLVSNDALKYAKKLVASNYPQLDAIAVLGNNELYELQRPHSSQVSDMNGPKSVFDDVVEKQNIHVPSDDHIENESNLKGKLFVMAESHLSNC